LARAASKVPRADCPHPSEWNDRAHSRLRELRLLAIRCNDLYNLEAWRDIGDLSTAVPGTVCGTRRDNLTV